MPCLSSLFNGEAIIMAYEKDLDDIMYENYVCLFCGWFVQPNIIDECGCEEE
jgi:hypothetical protein